jgi:hypothetical protein
LVTLCIERTLLIVFIPEFIGVGRPLLRVEVPLLLARRLL